MVVSISVFLFSVSRVAVGAFGFCAGLVVVFSGSHPVLDVYSCWVWGGSV